MNYETIKDDLIKEIISENLGDLSELSKAVYESILDLDPDDYEEGETYQEVYFFVSESDLSIDAVIGEPMHFPAGYVWHCYTIGGDDSNVIATGLREALTGMLMEGEFELPVKEWFKQRI